MAADMLVAHHAHVFMLQIVAVNNRRLGDGVAIPDAHFFALMDTNHRTEIAARDLHRSADVTMDHLGTILPHLSRITGEKGDLRRLGAQGDIQIRPKSRILRLSGRMADGDCV
jgi:hypothetical protein